LYKEGKEKCGFNFGNTVRKNDGKFVKIAEEKTLAEEVSRAL